MTFVIYNKHLSSTPELLPEEPTLDFRVWNSISLPPYIWPLGRGGQVGFESINDDPWVNQLCRHNKAYIQSSKLRGLVIPGLVNMSTCWEVGMGHPSSMGTGALALGAFPDPDLCTSLSGCSFLSFIIPCLINWCCAVLSCFQSCWPFVTSWTVAHQAPLSKGFSGKNILEWVINW